jgi:shikimate dehydrogenase
MKRYALIGYPLDHSFSPEFFRSFFADQGIEACYDAIPLPSLNALEGMIKAEYRLIGFNVTHPYKEAILPLLFHLSEEALETAAVNAVFVRRTDKGFLLYGHNTDTGGFSSSLDSLEIKTDIALILGCGGASKAIAKVFRDKKLPYHRLCRRPAEPTDIAWEAMDASMIRQYDLIVNATPVGTFPADLDKPEIPYEGLRTDQFLYDLVYNPPLTPFLKEAERRGIPCCNGMDMLRKQAWLSWEWWRKMEQ